MKKSHLILFGLLLSFTVNATNDIPRPEYPRPQFERTEWINLNGTWTYEFDLPTPGKTASCSKLKVSITQLQCLSVRKASCPE